MSWSAVRNTFDYLWYGPIDGVTTTGIATREGGLSALLFSTPVGLVLTSVAVLGLISVMVNRLWQHRVTTIGMDMIVKLMIMMTLIQWIPLQWRKS